MFAAEEAWTSPALHLPPGASKWNKIEHRLFSAITMNWRGRPLVSHEVNNETISAVTTRTGLKVTAVLDTSIYPKGIRIPDKDMTAFEARHLQRHQFHGNWNYTIRAEPPGDTTRPKADRKPGTPGACRRSSRPVPGVDRPSPARPGGVVKGLGSDSPQWDTASVSGIVISAGEQVPGVFGALNVLKAEFLVARRLAFQGQRMHADAPGRQHPGDPGLYTDTLDGALYGEPPALLLLAQRSALDVLDKIAVTANEHFSTGLSPSRVEYSRYWRDPQTGQPRPQLGPGDKGQRCLLALAELAGDLTGDSMYPSARLLRNAGTHRLVHATTSEPTGPTQDTFSTVNLPELQSATIEALQVARAAYLYFVGLIDSQLSPPEGSADTFQLPNQR